MRFRTTKHKFGDRVYDSASYKLPLDGVSYNFNHQAAGIELGRIILSWQRYPPSILKELPLTKTCREEIQSLFDPHIDSIPRKIHEQLNWMSRNSITRPIVSEPPLST